MKYIFTVTIILILICCVALGISARGALDIADESLNVGKEAIQSAIYWRGKYCSTTEGQTDTECHEDAATGPSGTSL